MLKCVDDLSQCRRAPNNSMKLTALRLGAVLDIKRPGPFQARSLQMLVSLGFLAKDKHYAKTLSRWKWPDNLPAELMAMPFIISDLRDNHTLAAC